MQYTAEQMYGQNVRPLCLLKFLNKIVLISKSKIVQLLFEDCAVLDRGGGLIDRTYG